MSGSEGVAVGVWTLVKHNPWADYYECPAGHTFRYGRGQGGGIPATCAVCDGSVLGDVDARYRPGDVVLSDSSLLPADRPRLEDYPLLPTSEPIRLVVDKARETDAAPPAWSFNYEITLDGVLLCSGITSASSVAEARRQALDNLLETVKVHLHPRLPGASEPEDLQETIREGGDSGGPP